MSIQATERREQAFEEFAKAVHDALGERVHEIILYGSVARGDATERSDVDVLVVLDSKDETDELFQLSFDIGVKHGVAIIPHLQTKDHFESRQDWPFLKNVLSEGRSYG
ncbi:MAG: nucleotidyltransferase domain-containing protein [Euryarchaeota archaeon]|nr:nucleotidyltransferase domain-containing protein [Euryarchaeota archaeon]